jgi:hypothetical protein
MKRRISAGRSLVTASVLLPACANLLGGDFVDVGGAGGGGAASVTTSAPPKAVPANASSATLKMEAAVCTKPTAARSRVTVRRSLATPPMLVDPAKSDTIASAPPVTAAGACAMLRLCARASGVEIAGSDALHASTVAAGKRATNTQEGNRGSWKRRIRG